jgi:hypothetical protein
VVAFSAGGDGAVNPREPGVIADGVVVTRISEQQPTRWKERRGCGRWPLGTIRTAPHRPVG